jgi:small-conductance mechanosensitive channel
VALQDIRALTHTLIERTQHWLASTDFVDLALRILAAAATAAVVYFGSRTVLRLTSARLLRAGTGTQETPLPLASIVRTLGHTIARTSNLFVVVTALAVGGNLLPLPPPLHGFLHSVFVMALVIQTAIWAAAAMTDWLEGLSGGSGEDRRALASATTLVGTLARTALWVAAAVLILDNLGFNVTTLVAGLGIGGIAVGLAAQKILGDLFASLAIVLDKPFEYGDFIVAGQHMGTVERIGLKTTRLRALSGEQLVIANADLLESRIQNFKRMSERRVLFTLGIVYGTPRAKLETVPKIVRAAIEAQPNSRFDRSHFSAFADSALSFESVYYLLSPDYNAFMETQQAIMLTIYERFAEEKIDFAFPTRTLHVEGIPRLTNPNPRTESGK